MKRASNQAKALSELADALADDVMRLTDEELLQEVREDGGDPDEIARNLRASLLSGAALAGKDRLAKARASLNAARAQRETNVLALSFDQKRKVLQDFAANDGRLRERLTLAARKGAGASERELDDILSDLVALGAIDDAGNPT